MSELNVNVIRNDNGFCKRRAVAFNVAADFEPPSHSFKRVRLVLHSSAKRFRFILRFFATSETDSTDDETELHNLQADIQRLQEEVDKKRVRLQKIRSFRLQRQVLRGEIPQSLPLHIENEGVSASQQISREEIPRSEDLRDFGHIIRSINDDFSVSANEFEESADDFESAEQPQGREMNLQFIVETEKRRRGNRSIFRTVFTCN